MNDRELLDLIPFFENVSKVDSVYRILNDTASKGGGNSGALNGNSPSLDQNSSASSSLQKNSTSSPQPTVVSAAVSWFITIFYEPKCGAIIFKLLYNHTSIWTKTLH